MFTCRQRRHVDRPGGAARPRIFVRNLYCRFLCPVGAFLGVIAPRRVFRIKRWSECKACRICEKTCEWGAIRGPKIIRQSACVATTASGCTTTGRSARTGSSSIARTDCGGAQPAPRHGDRSFHAIRRAVPMRGSDRRRRRSRPCRRRAGVRRAAGPIEQLTRTKLDNVVPRPDVHVPGRLRVPPRAKDGRCRRHPSGRRADGESRQIDTQDGLGEFTAPATAERSSSSYRLEHARDASRADRPAC